jgi:hypothetical protein
MAQSRAQCKGFRFLWVELCAGCLLKSSYRVYNGDEISRVRYKNHHVVRVSDDGESPRSVSNLNSCQLRFQSA